MGIQSVVLLIYYHKVIYKNTVNEMITILYPHHKLRKNFHPKAKNWIIYIFWNLSDQDTKIDNTGIDSYDSSVHMKFLDGISNNWKKEETEKSHMKVLSFLSSLCKIHSHGMYTIWPKWKIIQKLLDVQWTKKSIMLHIILYPAFF